MKSRSRVAELLVDTLARLKASADSRRDPRAYDRRNQEIREIERKGLDAIPSDPK